MSGGRAARLEADALAGELRRRVRGAVRFDVGTRALYATDASNYRQVPIGVVEPCDDADVVETVAACRRFGAPVLPRGGGTSLAGQCCNVAVVLDFTRHMHRVLDVDPARRLATVEPGCLLDTLRDAAGIHGLTFGPDPATHNHCTLGGMLGNDSCGVHSLLAANAGLGQRTSDNTFALDVLTSDGVRLRTGETSDDDVARARRDGGRRGAILAGLAAVRDGLGDEIRRRYPRLPRRVSGYNLDALLPERGFHVARSLVGSEGTLVTILSATVHLVPSPGARALLVLGYPDVFAAGDHVTDILAFRPTGLEGLDRLLVEWVRARGDQAANLALFPPGEGFLLVEFGGDDPGAARQVAARCMRALARNGDGPHARIVDDPREQAMVWHVRESGLGSTAWVPGRPDTWPGWEDSAVPPERVGAYLRDLRALFDRYGYGPSLYGHLGQGCIHCRVDFDLYSAAGVRTYRAFLDDAAELVLRHGGSLSGEHGDGQARGALLGRMFGDRLVAAFRDVKRLWDPDGLMNPGKVVDAHPPEANLRLGPDYAPPPVATAFRYPEDRGSFARAALRCVGVGECRRLGGGVMCPSYMVTRDERHSTRGRARLLWEMLNGELGAEGWRSDAVKEALDLCLACKGCKSDCPVNVDMATYKAEFLHQHHARRFRPRQAWAMGRIWWWARLASHAPRAANALAAAPVLGDVAKWLGRIAPARRLPRFASEPFPTWFRRRPTRTNGARRVLLWPDTFTSFFHPGVGRAAVEVLEAAGFAVALPGRPLCCGRPLYDFGWLDVARRLLRDVLDALRAEIRAGVPLVGLEPSCVAVFRDELPNLFPDDEDARRLRGQSFLLSEWLRREAPDFHPWVGGRAILQGHCHQKAVMGLDEERALLDAMDVTVCEPEPGCCGMAGAFGFERGARYDVSIACGERALLPAVRAADARTLVVADGFSCREQIAQGTGRTPLHLAEVIRRGLDGAW